MSQAKNKVAQKDSLDASCDFSSDSTKKLKLQWTEEESSNHFRSPFSFVILILKLKYSEMRFSGKKGNSQNKTESKAKVNFRCVTRNFLGQCSLLELWHFDKQSCACNTRKKGPTGTNLRFFC